MAQIAVLSDGVASDESKTDNSSGIDFTELYGKNSSLHYIRGYESGGAKTAGTFELKNSDGNISTFYDLPRADGIDRPAMSQNGDTFGSLSMGAGNRLATTKQWFDSMDSAATRLNTSTNAYQFGAFASYTAASGKFKVTSSYTFDDGKIAAQAIIRTDGSGAFEKVHYEYSQGENPTTGATVQLLERVTLSRGKGSTGYNSATVSTRKTIRSGSYDYYDGDVTSTDAADGRMGDLKLVTI